MDKKFVGKKSEEREPATIGARVAQRNKTLRELEEIRRNDKKRGFFYPLNCNAKRRRFQMF